jgi:hypothetical protein
MTMATRSLVHSAAAAIAFLLIVGGSMVVAQPLVSGGLVIYYDYDNFTNTIADGSGNGFNGKVQDGTRNVLDQPFTLNTTGVISNDHTTFKRGGGAINFTHSTVAGEDPVFVDMDGQAVSDSSVSIPADTNAITLASWVNARSYATDFSIQQGASGGHGVPHFQIQSSGAIRFTIRDNAGQNVVDSGGTGTSGGQPQSGHPVPNQPAVSGSGAAPQAWPLNEWHHVAVTFDATANAGAGQLDMFYDGTKIKTMANTGPGTAIGPWQLRAFSDYYDGLGLGAVYDSGSRRAEGWLDETYIFNRKLTDTEILTLYNLGDATQEGDHNEDGKVDAADYVAGRKLPDNFGGDPAWYNTFKANFGEPASGSGGSVPEPASLSLLLPCIIYLSRQRKR